MTASVKVLESEKGVAAGPVAMTQTTEGFASDVKDSKIGTVALSSVKAKKVVPMVQVITYMLTLELMVQSLLDLQQQTIQ